jgi:2-oxoglutarate ferredoxin oxidoreductase subunit delta
MEAERDVKRANQDDRPEGAPSLEGCASGDAAVHIDLYRAWCKGCGICVAFCPKGALAQDEAGHLYVKDADLCIGCGWCEIRCPDFAITVGGKGRGGRNREEATER